jgi:hypothetical protein
MPPPKSIFVDRGRILATIGQRAAEQLQEAIERTSHYFQPQREQALAMAAWVPRDLQLLAGRLLSASERKRHQQALVAMAAEGLIDLGTRHVRLTPAGAAALMAVDRAAGRGLDVPPVTEAPDA